MAYFKGFLAYIGAFQGISRYRLWNLVIIAGIISLVLGLIIYTVVFTYGDNLGTLIIDWYPFRVGKGVMEQVAGWLSRAILGLMVFFVYKYLLLIILSPILSIMSEKVEVSLTGVKGKIFTLFGEILRAIRFNIRNLYKEVFYTLILFVLGFIPGFSPFAPFCIFLVQAYYLGLGFMDFYMERHYTYRQSIEIGKRNRFWLSGLGSAIGLTILIPFAGFFIAPVLATIAATEYGVKKM